MKFAFAIVVALAALAGTAVAVTPIRLQALNIPFHSPIDIEYSGVDDSFILSVNYPDGEPHALEHLSITQNPIGVFHINFTAYGHDVHGDAVRSLTDEIYVAAVPVGQPNGWVAGDIYFGTGEDGIIAKVRKSDGMYFPRWLDLNTQPGANLLRPRGIMRGGLDFDISPQQIWDGNLVISTTRGEIWIAKSDGTAKLINNIWFGDDEYPQMEVCNLVPNNPALYGFLAGKLITSRIDTMIVWERTNSINPALPPGVWQFPSYDENGTPIELEHVRFVPANAGNVGGYIFWGVDWGAQRLVVWQGATLQPYQNALLGFGEKPNNPNQESQIFQIQWSNTLNAPVFTQLPLAPGSWYTRQWEGNTFAPITPPDEQTDDCPYSQLLKAKIAPSCKSGKVNAPTDKSASLSLTGGANDGCVVEVHS